MACCEQAVLVPQAAVTAAGAAAALTAVRLGASDLAVADAVAYAIGQVWRWASPAGPPGQKPVDEVAIDDIDAWFAAGEAMSTCDESGGGGLDKAQEVGPIMAALLEVDKEYRTAYCEDIASLPPEPDPIERGGSGDENIDWYLGLSNPNKDIEKKPPEGDLKEKKSTDMGLDISHEKDTDVKKKPPEGDLTELMSTDMGLDNFPEKDTDVEKLPPEGDRKQMKSMDKGLDNFHEKDTDGEKKKPPEGDLKEKKSMDMGLDNFDEKGTAGGVIGPLAYRDAYDDTLEKLEWKANSKEVLSKKTRRRQRQLAELVLERNLRRPGWYEEDARQVVEVVAAVKVRTFDCIAVPWPRLSWSWP
jgi:hypothetical protein